MKNPLNTEEGCDCCISRRHFLTAACGACLGTVLPTVCAGSLAEEVQPAGTSTKLKRPRVRLVFACWAVKQDRPTWPHIGYDFTSEMNRVTSGLAQLCPEVEFIAATAHSAEDAQKLLASGDADRIDGYLVYQMNNWVPVMQVIVGSGKPTLVADFLYAGSGGFLTFTAKMRETQKNLSVVSSSRIEDLSESARCFTVLAAGKAPSDFAAAADAVRRRRTPEEQKGTSKEDRVQVANIAKCIEALKQSKMLVVGGAKSDLTRQVADTLGIQTVPVGFEELKAACENADAEQAKECAVRWRTTARKVTLDDGEETLNRSARCYLGQQFILSKHKGDAITINCLGGFYNGHLPAYPCLGFVELLDHGSIGACEADVMSTATMLAMKHLINRPGFISDPVLDTSKRQIIYAHCVAPTRMFGPAGTANPFEILSHAEDQRGASVRSFLPQGYMTSTLEINPRRGEILFHRAKAVDNVVIERACRTKLAAEVVGDMEKLFRYWGDYGWHRVTYYGDLREPVRELAAALNLRFIEEA
jgi:hypothetical protein